MTERPAPSSAEFDEYAAEYDAALQEGLKLTGAGKEHYAEQRALFLRDRLHALGITKVARVLDFGCGDFGSFSVMARKKLLPRCFIIGCRRCQNEGVRKKSRYKGKRR